MGEHGCVNRIGKHLRPASVGRTARRGLRSTLALVGVGVAATSLTGCGLLDWGSRLAPSSVPSPSVQPSVAPTSTAPTPPPSQTPTEVATVTKKASGNLRFYGNLVSDAMTGSCAAAGPLTVSLVDRKNDFYSTVDVVAVIDTENHLVTSIAINTGEDSEGGIHKMSYSAAAPVAGTSARVTGSGPTYKLTGTLQDQDSPHGKATINLIPFTLQVTCKG